MKRISMKSGKIMMTKGTTTEIMFYFCCYSCHLMVKFLLKIATENSRKLYIHSRDDLKIFFTQVRGDIHFRKTKCRTVYLQTNVEYLLVKFSYFVFMK